ncbi:calpain-13-like [Leptodactylus fuscus]|uniref:calpain-13-like n=1 Tax=Leptodactylus fuscus TaxID=238119 RepID=UPI003F4ED3BD
MSLVRQNSCIGSAIHTSMGTPENPQKFHNQDFETLREWHLKKRVLFTDESFPANMNSIGSRLKNEFNTHKIEWKRPTEICAAPHFVVDGVSLFDILQSRLGDCWVLSAIGSITLKPELLQKIMPLGQGYSVGYAGIFHFRFWHLGEWVDVVIDDKLPFLDGEYLSVRPSCENEFWPCLLEKAYAKFLGSYQNLHWGDPAEAFVNLTGGLTMTFNLKSPEAHTYWNMVSLGNPDTLMACISDKQDFITRNQSIHQRSYAGNLRDSCLNRERPVVKHNASDETQIFMMKEHGQGHLEEITDFCAPEEIQIFKVTENGQDHPEEIINGNAPEEIPTCNVKEHERDVYTGNRSKRILSDKLQENALLANGLVERHAYSITDFAEVPFRNGFVRLIRIWNPWGFGEWKGKWNDRCPLWQELREADRRRLHRNSEDGEFWMCWEDFIQEFSRIIICNQVPNFYDWGDQHKKWYRKMFQNRWTMDNISWNQIDKDFFLKNPLYSIQVTGSDEVKSGVNVVLSLIQNSRNRQKVGEWLPIGFVLVKLPDSDKQPLSSVLTPENISIIKSFKKQDVTKAFNLSPGRYGVILYTTQKDHESSFLFQVFLKSEGCSDDITSQQSLMGLNVPDHESIFRFYATKGPRLHAWDLKRYLNDVVRKEYPYPCGAKFTIDGSREILASVDISGKGKLDEGKFLNLWKIIGQFKDLFSKMDSSRCGFLSLAEFQKVMQHAGLNVHNDLLYQLFARYSDAEGRLSFVDYIICAVRLKGALKTFYTLSEDGKGAYVHFEKWIQLMV